MSDLTPPLTTTLDELREALKTVPTIKALTDRLGTFNDAWWDRFAVEVAAAQPAPPTEALRLLRELVGWFDAREAGRPVTAYGPGAALITEARRYLEGAVASPAPLDVERLARALVAADRRSPGFYELINRGIPDPESGYQASARIIAAAYALEGQPVAEETADG